MRGCGNDPVLAGVRRRIANLTLVPEKNAEHMQVLRYEKGQFYRTHHDQNSPRTSAWGCARAPRARATRTLHAPRATRANKSGVSLLARHARGLPSSPALAPESQAAHVHLLHVPQ